MIIQVFEYLASFIEMIVGITVCDTILSESTVSRKRNFIAAMILAVILWLGNQVEIFSVVTTSIAIWGIAISTCVIKRVSIREAMFISCAYMVLLYIVDFLTLSIAGMMLQEDQMARFIAGDFSHTRICVMMTSKVILAGISMFLVKRVLTEVSIPVRKAWISLVLSALVLYYLIKGTFAEVDEDIAQSWLFLLAFFILGVYSVVQYAKYVHEKRGWEFQQECYKRDLEHYNNLIMMHEMSRHFFHDMKNQYVVLKQLLDNEEYNKAKEYLYQLEKGRPKTEVKAWTGIHTVDILLNYKIDEAKAKGILVNTRIENIETRLLEHEMITLLGNALDNAIEACERIQQGEKKIEIEILKQYEMMFIRIENTVSEYPMRKSGWFRTTKTNQLLHGYGLNSIRLIVERYDGLLKTEIVNGKFRLSASFFH